jgi:hypothetical protein
MIDLKDIKDKIITHFPNIQFTDNSTKKILILSFRNKFQKDYYFQISIDKHLTAVDISAILNNDSTQHYFWYTDIVFTDKDLNLNELKDFIYTNVEILSNYKSKVTQKINWILQEFTLEYYDDKWVKHSQRNGFRFSNLNFPKISSKVKIYE